MGWVKVLVVLAVLLEGTVGVAWFVGTRLPPEHRAVASGLVGASRERVWELMTRTVSQENWRTGLVAIQNGSLDTSDGVPCWTENRPSVKQLGYCATEDVPGVRRVVQMDGRGHGYGGMVTYDLQPADGGTNVTITARTLVDAPLWRFYGKYVLRGRTDARQYLLDLQAEAVRYR